MAGGGTPRRSTQEVTVAQALYAQVYDTLRRRIEGGDVAVGDRLPSEAELIEEFGVSAITITRALTMLRTDGFVTRRPRIGTVVVSRAPQHSASGASPLIGYVVPEFDDAFGTRVLHGLLDGVRDRGHVVLATSHGDAAAEERLIERQLERGVAALVLQPSSSEFIPPSVVALAARQFPLVVVDRTLSGIPVSTVASDNAGGGRLAAEHLFELGHERIGLVLSAYEVSSQTERRRGFVDAHAARHVRMDPAAVDTVRSVVPGSRVSADEDVEHLERYLRTHDDLTAVVASEFHTAELLRQAAARAGRRIGDDLALVSFDAPPGDTGTTHLRQDQHRIGQRAADLAIAQLDEPGALAQEVVPMELVIGDSAAAG